METSDYPMPQARQLFQVIGWQRVYLRSVVKLTLMNKYRKVPIVTTLRN